MGVFDEEMARKITQRVNNIHWIIFSWQIFIKLFQVLGSGYGGNKFPLLSSIFGYRPAYYQAPAPQYYQPAPVYAAPAYQAPVYQAPMYLTKLRCILLMKQRLTNFHHQLDMVTFESNKLSKYSDFLLSNHLICRFNTIFLHRLKV